MYMQLRVGFNRTLCMILIVQSIDTGYIRTLCANVFMDIKTAGSLGHFLSSA